jgi:demethylmenaquinone methyltransferase/2-methoxy-6-polyprenyl-1,4-benzoquinol methylase
MDEIDVILDEQRRYYRGRATTYDEWWLRVGAYDRGESERVAWAAEVERVEEALLEFGATGDVLELAGGTGWWTERLARTADRLTVVDASPETLGLNRARVARDDVEYVVADIFRWQPDRQYDVVFFSFWLSHVPRTHIGAFWQLVRSSVAADGSVFVLDNASTPRPTSGGDPHVAEYRPDLHLRRLPDGSELRVVKVMYTPEALAEQLRAEGWEPSISGTDSFVFGSARPIRA